LATIPQISIKRTITYQHNSISMKKKHDIWRKKSRSWLRTGT